MLSTLTANADSITATANADTFNTTSTNFSADDTLNGGAGADILSFTNAATVTAAMLANKTGIDIIRFSTNGNSIELSDTFVDASDADNVELANGSFTIANVNTSQLTVGHNVIIGGTGTVTLANGANNQVSVKNGVNSSIVGGTGNDTITGGTGNDRLNGGSGNDSITGGSGNDSINAGAGDDMIVMLGADISNGDSIAGGAGRDTLLFATTATINSTDLARVNGIEVFAFAADGNVLALTQATMINAGGSIELDNGDHTITSLNTAAARSTNNVTVGGTGVVTLAAANNRVVAKDGVNTVIRGGTGNDTILGGTGNDAFSGGRGNDSINAGGGNDTVSTLDADINSGDRFSGGAGIDILRFTDRASIAASDLARVDSFEVIEFSADNNSVALSDAAVLNAGGVLELNNGSHTIASLNNAAVLSTHNVVIGGSGAVTLANNANNRVVAKDGVNTVINGGSGNDTILGGTGNDLLSGGTGNDSINAGGGDDTVIAASGNNTINGGTGADILRYTSAASLSGTNLTNISGVEAIELMVNGNTITLNDAAVESAGGTLEIRNNAVTVTSLDSSAVGATNNVVINGTGEVTLANNAGNRVTAKDGVNTSIIGGSGNDTVIGGSGNDTIIVANLGGADSIAGGGGTDTLIFTGAATITTDLLSHLSGIEVLQFMADNNVVTLSDAMGPVLINNGAFSIVNLDTQAVTNSQGVVIGGTGAVTLAANAGNKVAVKDGVNASIIGGLGNDTITGGTGNDTIVLANAAFSTGDSIAGGDGTDTLLFTDAVTVTADKLSHVTGVEVLKFSANGNNLVLNDNSVELNNSSFSITSLDSSLLTGDHQVTVNGTGAVTLADGVHNKVTTKDGVNTVINGGTGNDTIRSGSGNDLLNGGAGDDTFINITGNDTVIGGDGIDSLIFTEGMVVSEAVLAHVSNIEKIYLSSNVSGITLSEAFVDSAHEQTVILNNSTYMVIRLDSSAVHSAVVIAGSGQVTLNDNAGNSITAEDGVNTSVIGGTGNDTFIGGTGNDNFSGMAGDDVFVGVTAGDTVSGGTGTDSLLYSNIATITASTFTTASGIDRIMFNANGNLVTLNDAAVASADTGSLELGNGVYTIASLDSSAVANNRTVTIAGTGAVTLADNAGNHVTAKDGVNSSIIGGSGNDTVTGGTGNDNFVGGAGDDSFMNFTASDTVAGGTGTDTVAFTQPATMGAENFAHITGVEILQLGANGNSLVITDNAVTSSDTGNLEIQNSIYTANVDSSAVSNGHNIIIAGTGSVVLANNAGNRVMAKDGVNVSITGGSGNDSITGGSGNDDIVNVTSGDTVDGGAGNNRLVFTQAAAVNTAMFAHISNIGELVFNADGNMVQLSDGILTQLGVSDIILNNGAQTITSLDSTAVHGNGNIVIRGTGAVTLADTGGRVVTAASVNTHIIGGNGDDTVVNGSGDDLLEMGAGNDTVIGLSSGDTVNGGEGVDSLVFTGAVTMAAMAFANVTGIEVIQLTGSGSNLAFSDAVVANADGEYLEIRNDDFTIASLNSSAVGLGHDVVIAGAGKVTLADGAANRVIASDDINASIQGGSGNDTIIGGAGSDHLSGGLGNDSIVAGSGNDIIITTDAALTSADRINGGTGSDTLLFTDVAAISTSDLTNIRNIETIMFSADNNTVALRDANVSNAGGVLTLDNDSHSITSLDTSLVSNARSVLISGNGAVTLANNTGNRVFAKEGTDSNITGGTGNDTIIGSTGEDNINGGAGRDVLTGNDGNDRFIITALADSTPIAADRIVDFVQGADLIVVAGTGVTGIQAGAATDTVLGYSSNGSFTLITNAASTFQLELTGVYTLGAVDFVFV